MFYNADCLEYYCINPVPPWPWLLKGGRRQTYSDVVYNIDPTTGDFALYVPGSVLKAAVLCKFILETISRAHASSSRMTFPMGTFSIMRFCCFGIGIRFFGLQAHTTYALSPVPRQRDLDVSPNNLPDAAVLVQMRTIESTAVSGFGNNGACQCQPRKS